jgi:hypothetical protein
LTGSPASFYRSPAIFFLLPAGIAVTAAKDPPKESKSVSTDPPKDSKQKKRYPFGKGYIRPTRSEAEATPEKFYELIAYLHERRDAKRKLTWHKIGELLGIDPTNAQRRVESERLEEHECKLVLDYIYDESRLIVDPDGLGLTEFRDYLYFAALGFYDIKATSQDNARANLVGTYHLWRHSVENPDEFVHGRLDFEESEESGALCATMIQSLKPKPMMRASTEEFKGYVFRMAHMYVMLLRDIANNDPRITIFPSFRDEFIGTDKNPKSIFAGTRKHVVHMDGFGMGIDGKKVFLSPVYIELVDDKDELNRLNASLDVVSEADTPKRIVKKLRRMPIVVE